MPIHRGYNWGMMQRLGTMGERITALRKPAGYKTQRALATRLGVSDAFLSDIVRGIKNPSLEMLGELAGLLNTTTDYLLLRTDNPDVPGAVSLDNGDPIYFSSEADEIARIVDAFTPETRMFVLHMVRTFAAYMAGTAHAQGTAQGQPPGDVERVAPGVAGRWVFGLVRREPEGAD
jgi:transcriptional regulator with XRE-family HTH domain